MRVAILSPYALSVPGGVQEQVLGLSRVLGARGHEVLVVAPDAGDTSAHDTPATLVRLGRRLALPANGSRAPLTLSPRAARGAERALAAFGPDVVHLHEPGAPVLAWAALLAHRRPTVATFHRAGGGPAVSLTRPLLRRLARGVDEAVAVSEAARRLAEATYALRCEVLFNGIEMERYVAVARERAAEVTLLFLGRLEARKGADTAIRAVREHNATDAPPWRLVVAGDGPERARLEALAAHDARITFVGRVSDGAKRSWLRRCHALLAPATGGESFGLVLLEALASETVVVASDIEGYREAVGPHATLAPPGDPRAWARAIETALAHESPIGVAAAREHARRWSMAALADAYLERYERLVAAGGGAHR
ncbi:MAG TPA: glycosyltransferase family 4 protein [Acidimicrobiales bacterium]|nr:glycosyltransferase family 4 protein [Acidimicrobiales bacterium]